MQTPESLKELYQRKFGEVPDGLNNGIGHFNVFKVEPFQGKPSGSLPYQKRDFYKITVLTGNSQIEFADKTIHVPKQALVFSNPFIPYRWEHNDKIHTGHYAIFNEEFFYQYGKLFKYPVFQPEGEHVFELNDEQYQWVISRFQKMHEEIDTDYEFKYDLLRAIAQEIIHFGLKLNPSKATLNHKNNASQRITSLFLELLERQFPIDDLHPTINLRKASEYAEKLNVHTNHLNRAIKEVTGKTTTQIISERVLQESKVLLKQTALNVAEISNALGYAEPTHFNNFFKKNTEMSPSQFRNV